MTGRFRRVVAALLIVCIGGIGAPLQVQAGIVSTDTVVAGAVRERLTSLLERGDVSAQLRTLGVDPAMARDRVAALSDAEAAQLAAQLDGLPAGGSDFLTVALIVFLVLLLTDILGYTKIFPFTRPAATAK